MRPKFRLILWLLFLLSGLTAVSAGAAAEPRVVRYEPTESDFKYVYGTMAPVATLLPVAVLDTRTADCKRRRHLRDGRVPGSAPAVCALPLPRRHRVQEQHGISATRSRAHVRVEEIGRDELHADREPHIRNEIVEPLLELPVGVLAHVHVGGAACLVEQRVDLLVAELGQVEAEPTLGS